MSLLCLLALVCSDAYAKNWQVMLIPDNQTSLFTIKDEALVNALVLQGISAELVQQLDRVVSSERVFANCELSLCEQSNLQGVLQRIASKAPEVDLALFFGFQAVDGGIWLHVNFIDPLSYERYDAYSLRILGAQIEIADKGAKSIDLSSLDNVQSYSQIQSQIQSQIKSAAAEIGRVTRQRLQEVQKRNEFVLLLEGFTLDEVAPFPTFVLSATNETGLTLLHSKKQSTKLAAYLPIMSIKYSVSSNLTQSQFNQLLALFFKQQNISIVSEYQREQQVFLVSRLGNPYTPSLITTVFLFFLASVLLFLIVKRHMFHHQLDKFAQSKSVDRWLEVFEQARAPWFMLNKKWLNQHSYWQRLQRESSELEKQAKLFFEAGDSISAKLFISKSLNLNSDAAIARELITKIANQELSQKDLSDKEQRVRNKVAKSMNNFRNKRPIKALRQAYQALNESASDKRLKRQHKAIKRLLQKINVDFAQSADYLELSNLNNGETCLLCALPQVNIGRASNSQGNAQHGSQDFDRSAAQNPHSIDFYINHKAISRVGKQCKVVAQEEGFYLQDLDSTNGTYLNGKKISNNESMRLQHRDTINLGADSELSAVSLDVSIDKNHSLMKLNVSEQLRHTLDLADLARAWPDYVQAMRGALVLTFSDLVLALNKQSSELEIISLSELQHAPDYLGLVRVWLGDSASIAPLLDSKGNDEKGIWCNDEPLLGVIPLILPCELRYMHYHVRIDEYLQGGKKRRANEADSFQLLYRSSNDA